MLARLVAFDTTSRHSNLALIEFVEGWLAEHGIASRRVPNEDGSKTNLYATIGPMAAGGVILSGHTDVVPVDGQAWTSDPWTLTERDGKLFGRGTCDMKGFIALALAAVPDFAAMGLARPIHLALSYDEEVGCLGAPSMIARLAAELPPVAAAVIGEPSSMELITAHKGIASWRVTVTGHEAHSSLTHLGVSANMVAVELMHWLAGIADELAGQGDPIGGFLPPHATLTIGQINGDTAVNILAGRCEFVFDLRTLPGQDPVAILAPFFRRADALDASIAARFAGCGVEVVQRSQTPALAPVAAPATIDLVRRLAGDNGTPRSAAYAAEAGQFQEAGFDAIICGPGSIDQAHQPDEYVSLSQLQRGAVFMQRLGDALAR